MEISSKTHLCTLRVILGLRFCYTECVVSHVAVYVQKSDVFLCAAKLATDHDVSARVVQLCTPFAANGTNHA